MIRVNTGKKARFLTWDDTCVEFNNLGDLEEEFMR